MSRYIDADALKKRVSELIVPDWTRTLIRSWLDSEPTVDAVPVVRCGECIHRYVDGENVRFNVCELNHNKVQADDWYCADGKRKDNETKLKGE